MALTDNLVFSLEMGEASGDALDAHGSLDFTETGGTIGAAGGFRDFEAGDTEYFEHADHADLSSGNADWTMSFEINAESLSGFPVIGQKGWTQGTTNSEWVLYVNTAGGNVLTFGVEMNGSGTNEISASSFGGLSTATLYHLIIWHDATNNEIGISVNDVDDTEPWSAGINDGPIAMQLGASSFQGLYFDGLMRRVRRWTRVLTAEERTQLYNSGNGLAYEDLDGGGGAVVGSGLLRSKKLSRLSRVG